VGKLQEANHRQFTHVGRGIPVTCQGRKELVSCINCGRILYYTRDMALAAAE
jgi:hypothetical protein